MSLIDLSDDTSQATATTNHTARNDDGRSKTSSDAGDTSFTSIANGSVVRRQISYRASKIWEERDPRKTPKYRHHSYINTLYQGVMDPYITDDLSMASSSLIEQLAITSGMGRQVFTFQDLRVSTCTTHMDTVMWH